MSAITVRPIETVDEYRACQQIQRRAWGITDDTYLVPVATMISVQHAGGLVLGAFEGERLIGFSFAYLGRVRGRWALYSQLTGVDPEVQAHGVGEQLKRTQRAWTKAQGLALVAWTFDPMQAGNANFNLRHLGAFCRTYQVDYFGERTDALSAGLDSDRLLAEWPVEDAPIAWRDEADCPPLRIDVPLDLAVLKAREPETARAWQRRLRDAFVRAFADGYIAMDFVREQTADGPRASYQLRRPVLGASLDRWLALPASVRDLLGKLKAGLTALYGERLKGLYLFGSYARGDYREDSDINVLVVLDTVADYWSEIDRTSELTAALCLEYTVLIDRKFVSEDDWQRSTTNFMRNVRDDVVPM